MRKLVLASSLLLGVLFAAPSAFAGGRTLKLKTILAQPLGTVFLRNFQEKTITVRTPLGVRISEKRGGGPGTTISPFVPVQSKLSRKGDSLLFKLGRGTYYADPANKTFSVLRAPILTTR